MGGHSKDGAGVERVPARVGTYLGRVMTSGDDDWPSVAGNLAKARRSWGRLQRILRREGATPWILGSFFKAVVQQVLLFGAETGVVTPKMERALSGFLHGAARRLTGRQARRAKAEIRESMEMAFEAYGEQLELVPGSPTWGG